MSHIVDPTQVEGSKTEALVSDDNVQDTLMQILKELKKMNVYLSLMTDVNVDSEEVEIT